MLGSEQFPPGCGSGVACLPIPREDAPALVLHVRLFGSPRLIDSGGRWRPPQQEGGPRMRTARLSRLLFSLLPLVTVLLVVRGQAAGDSPLIAAAKNGDVATV